MMRHVLKPLQRFVLTLALLFTALPHAPLAQSARAEAARVDTVELTSRVFHNTRTLRILLPPGYASAENATRRYPVMYLNDGSLYFEPTAMDVATVVTDLIQRGVIRPLIVVGIDSAASLPGAKNPELDRADEYIPYPDTGFPPDHLLLPAEVPNPHGTQYPAFLIDDVMTFVNTRYRTATGPENTGLGGYSYGGVASLYTAMTTHGVIGKLLLESTPLWIGPDNRLLKEALKTEKWPAAIYVGLGTKDGDEDEGVNREWQHDVQGLADTIHAVAPSTRLKLVIETGGRHRPPAWHRRLPAALTALWSVDPPH